MLSLAGAGAPSTMALPPQKSCGFSFLKRGETAMTSLGNRKLAAGLAALYGIVSIVGGIMGFVNASSVPSLVAGGLAGLFLLAAAAVAYRGSLGKYSINPVWGLIAIAVVA